METNETTGMMAAFGILAFFVLAMILFFVVCHWMIFTKAGEKGWKSLIPIYNAYVQLRITRQPGIWLLYFFIPIVNIYFGIRHVHGLSRAFGKDVGFTIGLILLPIIFYPLLAFGNAPYQYGPTEDGLIHELQSV